MRKTFLPCRFSSLVFPSLLLPIFFLLTAGSAFGQYACFGYAAVNDFHNCGVQGVGYSGTDSQGNAEAYAIQVWLGSASGGERRGERPTNG